MLAVVGAFLVVNIRKVGVRRVEANRNIARAQRAGDIDVVFYAVNRHHDPEASVIVTDILQIGPPMPDLKAALDARKTAQVLERLSRRARACLALDKRVINRRAVVFNPVDVVVIDVGHMTHKLAENVFFAFKLRHRRLYAGKQLLGDRLDLGDFVVALPLLELVK